MTFEGDNRPDVPTCKRCGCCETYWEACEECGGDGGSGQSNCIDDLCNGGDIPCMHGDDVEYACQTCQGKGGWNLCTCDDNGKHKSQAQTQEPRKHGLPGGSEPS